MSPKTILFFGLAGCGKGTQTKLLKEALEVKDKEHKVVVVETGKLFREFMDGKTYSSAVTKEILDEGGLLPEFLPIWIWTQFFVYNLSGGEHLICDGLARRELEAPVLDGAFRFYKRENPNVIFLKVSRDWAFNRLKERNRYDDNDEDIKRRLDWFDEHVVPAMHYFERHHNYSFYEVDGEQSVEDVHAEIMRKLSL